MISSCKPSGISVIGVGHHLPTHCIDNEELCRHLDVTPDWIVEKTGIRRRCVAEPEDTLSEYAARATQQALQMANVSPEDIDLIIVCTFSADYVFPPVAAKVQDLIGAKGAHIFDVQANCAGLVTGLTCASDRMSMDPSLRYAVVIGAEFCTRYIDGTDPNTAIYLADGAGATVLGRTPAPSGLLSAAFFSDTSNYESVRLRGGGSSYSIKQRAYLPEIDLMEMNGLATWKQAITHLPTTVRRACQKATINISDVDFFIFHQANLTLIDYIVKKLRASADQTYTNVQDIGNTGAASLAIALSEAVMKGYLDRGAVVVLAGVGAGFNFGASVWRWGMDKPETCA